SAAIGHVDTDPLLAADDRAQPARDRGLDDRRRREAEQRRDALALQDLGDRVHDLHRRCSPWAWRRMQKPSLHMHAAPDASQKLFTAFPAKAGTHGSTALPAGGWIPAFAGN